MSLLQHEDSPDGVRLRQRLESIPLDRYRYFKVVEFSITSVAEFERLRREQIRIGTNDLRIASIALARNETLLTRNSKDFSKVPGLRSEDWTR